MAGSRLDEFLLLVNDTSSFLKKHGVADRLAVGVAFLALFHRGEILVRSIKRRRGRERIETELATLMNSEVAAEVAREAGEQTWRELLAKYQGGRVTEDDVALFFFERGLPMRLVTRVTRAFDVAPRVQAAADRVYALTHVFQAWLRTQEYANAFRGGKPFPEPKRRKTLGHPRSSTAPEVRRAYLRRKESEPTFEEQQRVIDAAEAFVSDLIPSPREIAETRLRFCPVCRRVFVRPTAMRAQKYCQECRARWSPKTLWLHSPPMTAAQKKSKRR